MDRQQVELAPYTTGERPLDGFVVSGRWPDSTQEWAYLLRLLLRVVAIPGMLRSTSVFRSLDDKPVSDANLAHPVGLLAMAGPVVGEDAPRPGELASPRPAAVLLLHPPGEDPASRASGCVLLPGLPHLGLDHRAAWVAADADDTVTRLVASSDVDPAKDPDTAVLALLVAA